MSGMWTEDDLRSTIPFEEIDLDDTDNTTASDLLDALPDEPPEIERMESTVARLAPQIAEEKPTTAQPAWDLTPPLRSAQRFRDPKRVYDDVTAVRERPVEHDAPQWIDVRALVDDDGRLKLPSRIAERLREGAVVEIRIAEWALSEE